MPDGDAITLFTFYYYGAFLNCANSQDGNLWLIDNWSSHDTSKRTNIGEREGSTFGVIGLKSRVSCSISKTVHLFVKANEIELVSILNYGNNEIPCWQSSGHSNINIFLHDQPVAIKTAIQPRIFLYAFNNGFNK